MKGLIHPARYCDLTACTFMISSSCSHFELLIFLRGRVRGLEQLTILSRIMVPDIHPGLVDTISTPALPHHVHGRLNSAKQTLVFLCYSHVPFHDFNHGDPKLLKAKKANHRRPIQRESNPPFPRLDALPS